MATWPTITDDDGSGTTGTVLDDALFDSIRDYINNGMTAVSFNAANFTASTGSWTLVSGDQSTFSYLEIGKLMVVTFDLVTTTVSATPGELRIAIPNGRTAAIAMPAGAFAYNDNATTRGTGMASVAGSTISLFRDLAGLAWSAATDTTRVQGTILFAIS